VVFWLTLGGALFVGWPSQWGGNTTYVVVRGNSMLPNYHTGDIVVARERDRYDVGEVLVYEVPDQYVGAGALIMHRLVEVDAGGKFIVQGDNREEPDKFDIYDRHIRGSEVFHIPKLGLIMNYIGTWWFISLLVGLFIFVQLWPEDEETSAVGDEVQSGGPPTEDETEVAATVASSGGPAVAIVSPENEGGAGAAETDSTPDVAASTPTEQAPIVAVPEQVIIETSTSQLEIEEPVVASIEVESEVVETMPSATTVGVPVAAESPAIDKSAAVLSAADALSEPVEVEPVAGEPVVEVTPAEPVAPVVVELAIPEPVAVESVVVEPGVAEPVAVESVVVEPGVAEPVAVESVVVEPLVPKPVVAEPVAEPVTGQPVAPEPAAVEPVAQVPVEVVPVAVETAAAAAIIEPAVVGTAAVPPTAVPARPTRARLTPARLVVDGDSLVDHAHAATAGDVQRTIDASDAICARFGAHAALMMSGDTRQLVDGKLADVVPCIDRDAARAAIHQHVAAFNGRLTIVVVSDDGAVIEDARALGAKTMTCAQWLAFADA
jgi:signal peptidase I